MSIEALTYITCLIMNYHKLFYQNETFDLKNLDNLEQIQYIDSKFNEMFKYGLEKQDLTKDMFKELFETYYNNERNYLSYN